MKHSSTKMHEYHEEYRGFFLSYDGASIADLYRHKVDAFLAGTKLSATPHPNARDLIRKFYPVVPNSEQDFYTRLDSMHTDEEFDLIYREVINATRAAAEATCGVMDDKVRIAKFYDMIRLMVLSYPVLQRKHTGLNRLMDAFKLKCLDILHYTIGPEEQLIDADMRLCTYQAFSLYFPDMCTRRIRPIVRWYNTHSVEDVPAPGICPVTLEEIKDSYIKCNVCRNKFDACIKAYWIDPKESCPLCRSKFNNYTIYHIV